MAAQTVLIKQTVPENFEDIDEGHGPNRAHFSYPYFALGMHTDGYSHENDTAISPSIWEINGDAVWNTHPA